MHLFLGRSRHDNKKRLSLPGLITLKHVVFSFSMTLHTDAEFLLLSSSC